MAELVPQGHPGRGPSYLREVNAHSVFARICAGEPVSATQLARQIQLSKPTVGLVIADLEEAGLVQSVGLRTGQSGRSPRLYSVRPQAGWVVVADVGRRWLGVLVADLAGTVLARMRRRSRRSAQGLLDQVSGLIEEVLADASVPLTDVLSIVIGSPGVYDASGDRLRHASNLPGWERPRVVGTLRSRLGACVTLENDVDLAAVGEQAYGLGAGVEDFVYLSVGTGLGMGVVIGGRLHRGAHGAAGEVAFLHAPGPRPVDPDGKVREQGMMEAVAAADGFVAAARAHGVTGADSPQEVLAAVAAGDPGAVAALSQELDHLAACAASVVALLDPQLVVVGGGIGRHLQDHLPDLTERVGRLIPLSLPRFAVSSLGEDATLMGGLAHGLAIARDRALSRLRADGPADDPADGSADDPEDPGEPPGR